jgi:transcription-repair coupling factor (superfamily II helicase)
MVMEPTTFSGEPLALLPRTGEHVRVSGLTNASAAYVLAQIIRRQGGRFLVYLPTPVEAEDFVRDLEFFWPEGAGRGDILLYPGYEIKPFFGESPAIDLVFSRLNALYALLSGKRPLVVAASAPGALQRSLPREALSQSLEFIQSGEEVDREGLIAYLVRSGYYSTSMVQNQGDFSVRGGILDVYPPGVERPVRAEFFGDFVDSLRSFRTIDQRSSADLIEQILLPANEVIYRPGVAEKTAAALTSLANDAGWLDLLWGPLVEKMGQAQYFPGLESFLPLFYERLDCLENFAPADTVRVVVDRDRIMEAGQAHLEKLETHMDRVRDEERPHLPLSDLYETPDDLVSSWEGRTLLEISGLAFHDSVEAPEVRFRVDTNQDLRALMGASRGEGLLAPLAARIKSWRTQNHDVVLACHTKEQARRLMELFQDYQLYPELETAGLISLTREDRRFRIVVGFLSQGFTIPALGAAFVTEDELFGPKRRVVRRAVEEVKGIHLSSFQDLGMGDYVVHTDHGIGQYLGLVKLDAGGRPNDYLHLAYRGGDKLYVPVDRFNAITKYVGSDDRPPALDKLGGTTWERVKARIKASIREMAEELIKLYATRQIKKGFAYSGRDRYFREFEAEFEYEETPDQMAAIDDVLQDMAREKPMDRLVCGDVGYGKTEVALRAGFRTVCDGKQVAVLVPTTVLAEQHYQTFRKRLENHPANVEVLSRFRKASEQKDIIRRVAEGQVDVVVGTHRLLQKDVAFKDLGLLIIDEEHRFGVTHKERLKKMRAEVDVLTLSATPIPRTLHMSLSGIRDLSVIETPPQDRRAIKTYLMKYDETTVAEAIARELERGGQVFFVHNRVKDIEMVAGRLQRLMPLVRFAVAHGQQKERELEKVMLGFLRREVDVLVTTTIIESGLDFPSANTIIINNADRFRIGPDLSVARPGREVHQAGVRVFAGGQQRPTDSRRQETAAGAHGFFRIGGGIQNRIARPADTRRRQLVGFGPIRADCGCWVRNVYWPHGAGGPGTERGGAP